jgi:hypothetical protein
LLVCKFACLKADETQDGACPSCATVWTGDQLREPPRLVLNMLSRVKVRLFVWSARGTGLTLPGAMSLL